ncbi:methionine adenosyltransferase domain-containing protein [Mycoplasma sp. SG1]|uniref:methionine adenosyltransferase domain-containing protein n=1 Tax=Mycoplasma sp. SG1 TaxID=2810348 RepID=UPI0020240707|nr:methionine adenosyltransferase domain-containing protein [Mycoplasma sp. SG1]URM52752.1 methionine adenosyltransferase domain-containing protein [Mycoplasma sp. SG1]
MLKVIKDLNLDSVVYSAESVGYGHPDKLADQIADLVVDHLRLDYGKNAKIACEVICGFNEITILGEINVATKIHDDKLKEINKDIKAVVFAFFKELTQRDSNYQSITEKKIVVDFNFQSQEIFNTITSPENNHVSLDSKVTGAGDQGYSFGYATSFGVDYFPTHAYLAHLLLRTAAKKQALKDSYLYKTCYLDMKSQVIGYYFEKNNQIHFHLQKIILSIQNKEGTDIQQFQDEVVKEIVNNVLTDDSVKNKIVYDSSLLDKKNIFVNSSGSFHIGGLFADTGATGRKIVVDSYGGGIPVGGGAFSGKDPSKLDRSGAYFARYIAKNIVAALNINQCLVSLHYIMGLPKLADISIEVSPNNIYNNINISKAVKEIFDLSIFNIINFVNSANIHFRDLSVFGHFARSDLDILPWEKLDKVEAIKEWFTKNKS